MINQTFNTPILFLIFNRPEETIRVFEEIKKVKPQFLYIASDGPRNNKVNEDLLCNQCRQIVLKGIDWPCEVKTLFRNENLGCGKAVSEAITWFFDNVEEGIILEDDCLPDPSFFTFCTEMLAKYRIDTRVMHIGASNFQLGKWRGNGDYYYSKYSHIWGWASWRRAWISYDYNVSKWTNKRSELAIMKIFDANESQFNYWKTIFDLVYKGAVDTWDYQWQFAIWDKAGLSILPNKNLVKNIGFGINATHTIYENKLIDSIPLENLYEFKTTGDYDKEADDFTFSIIFKEDFILKKQICFFQIFYFLKKNLVSLLPVKVKIKLKNLANF